MAAGTSIAFDIETGFVGPDREKFSLHPETAIVVGISFTESVNYAQYVPLGHDTGPNLDNRQAARVLWPMLASGRGVAHNASFELRHLSKWFRDYLSDDPDYGEAVRAAGGYFPIRSDTQVEAYIMAELQRFGLKYLTTLLFDKLGRSIPSQQLLDRARALQRLTDEFKRLLKDKQVTEDQERSWLAARFDGHFMTELHELFPGLAKNKRKTLRFNILELTEKVRDYACEDSCWCLAIHQRYYPQVKDCLVYKIDMAVLQCLCEMEEYGIRYDWNFMRQARDAVGEFTDRLNAEIMAELTEKAGTPIGINLASPAQVSKVLFDTLGFRTTVYTKSTKDLPPEQRKMSTGKTALTGLAKKHPVVKKIQNWKELTKLTASYLDKYEAQYSYAPDGHAHPNHLSAVVVTGRLAHQDPNYAQSPKKYHYDLAPAIAAHAEHAAAHGDKCDCGEFAPPEGTCFKFNFRDAIAAPPEHYILGFDLSQAELRAIAGEANETALLDAFAKGEDVHTLTASLMLSIPIDEVTPELRAIGKTMNFALLYGMGVKSLADRLGISFDEAQNLYDSYFAVYANIAEWAHKQVELGKRQGYVTSRFGRRLPIWNFQNEKMWIREQGERQCVNFPIQGGATGDYMRYAMVRARKALREAGIHDRVHMVMNVHDALEFYVHRSLQPIDVIRVLEPAVIYPVKGWPAMQADWHVAKTWGSPVELSYKDGVLSVKGNKEIDLMPVVEIDEETGEEVVELPEIDADALRRITARHDHDPYDRDTGQFLGKPAFDPQTGRPRYGEGRHVIVTLSQMPTEAGYERFLSMVDNLPGPNTLTLRTPEGDLPIDLPLTGTALDASHTAAVSLILGPVKITYDAADINPADMLQGLTL